MPYIYIYISKYRNLLLKLIKLISVNLKISHTKQISHPHQEATTETIRHFQLITAHFTNIFVSPTWALEMGGKSGGKWGKAGKNAVQRKPKKNGSEAGVNEACGNQ